MSAAGHTYDGRVAEASGWRPLQAGRVSPLATLAGLTGDSPFARLALTHVLAVAGDTLVTMALAGSLFFSISPHAARNRVALYLVLTMAPFAVVAPLLGPVLDRSRSGRRVVAVVCHIGRAVVCLVMARHLHSLLLFPEAFVVLVLSKAYLVTKAALVPPPWPTTAGSCRRTPAWRSSASSPVSPPPPLVPWCSSCPSSVPIGCCGSPLSSSRPQPQRGAPGPGPPCPGLRRTPEEAAELRGQGIRLGASAMAVLRGSVGFVTFLLAFAFRRAHAPSWWFGVAIVASLLGTLIAAVLAPRLRRVVSEERMLTASLICVAVAAAACARFGNRAAGAALAGVLGLAAAAGKLAFDAIVQRDAPDAGRGRAFTRFETRFQLVWVTAALVPVLVAIPTRVGMVVLAVACGGAAIFYVAGRKG